MGISIRKETVARLQKFSTRGEKHDNLVNRLLDICEREKEEINLSDETVERLKFFTGCIDVDEALNMVLDKMRKCGCGGK